MVSCRRIFCSAHQLLERSAFQAHLSKNATFTSNEIERGIELHDPPFVQDDKSIIVNDLVMQEDSVSRQMREITRTNRPNAMCDCND